jgi:peptide/nickel transport system substrate-binding protein
MRKLYWALIACLLAATAVGVSACGDDDDDDGGGTGQGGAKLTVASTGLDNADPSLYQTVQANQVFQLVYTPLVTYNHEEGDAGTEIVPGLAEEVPEATNNGRTYTFQLRDGLQYSDGTPVRASDFENTIKRLLFLESVWSSFFSGIEGADEFTEGDNFNGDISGIETNNQTGEITVNLTEPDTKVLFAIAEPYASPMPAAKAGDKALRQPPPGVGPYTLDVVDFTRLYRLERNPNFDLPEEVRPAGNFDEIEVQVSDSVTRMTQDVIDGEVDFMTEDPTGDQLTEVRQRYADRYQEAPNPPNVYFHFLNVTLPPFDKLEARQAVNYAMDSNALVRIFGGRLVPGCTFLPPQLVGYKEYECAYGEPDGPGDIERARELVRESGYEGEQVTFWTNNKDPRPAIAEYMADLLNEIGFDADIKTLDQQVYFEQVGIRKNRAQIGFTDWYQDYPHPGDFIDVLLSTESTKTPVSFNQGFVSDPRLDRELDRLRPLTPEEAAEDWGDLDEYVVNEQAYVAPYGYEESSSFFSERMDAQNCAGIHPVYKNDWSLFCLK